MENSQPTILFVSGLDPGGGAGLIADARVAVSLNCRILGALSCHTVQNECVVEQCAPVDPALFASQLDTLMTSYEIDALKIGLIPDSGLIDILADKLHDKLCVHPDMRVVLDPVIRSGNGYQFCDDATIAALFDRLLPLATIATPNLAEAQRLVPDAADAGDIASEMLTQGCEAALITGEEKSADTLTHKLYRRRQSPLPIACKRLPGRYHGSGCALAAAIACFLAADRTTVAAAAEAVEFTYCYLHAVAAVKTYDERFSEKT